MLKLGIKWLDAVKAIPLAVAMMGSGSLLAAEGDDPWEGFNRTMFRFNDALDRWALKPVAETYKEYTPEFIQTGVHNAYLNMGDGVNLVNNLLQGKVEDAGSDTSRVLFNSTFGVLGLVDVATPMGLQRHEEDFGQTLAVWGLNSGPYLVLPFFGPSTVRDGVGQIPDIFMQPYPYIDNTAVNATLFVGQVVDTRANLLSKEKLITGDRYVFIRNAYLQNREFLSKDGQVEDDF
ncbi:VacJ family lipoprotein [Azomonas macrocytogenes]|uniref:Phospholipid-binding lipoprotein MlaA n=1 Tax=Azomonas macrocytogenes TaxID=69962 RepID=A0A839T311_AZOMA|nr:VacJ family lipoprotein [Azomonas macrocytogenes]MBB3102355.1 phospholipid-binding lipoprotein MlaA [Azomonas macrocytogenes]